MRRRAPVPVGRGPTRRCPRHFRPFPHGRPRRRKFPQTFPRFPRLPLRENFSPHTVLTLQGVLPPHYNVVRHGTLPATPYHPPTRYAGALLHETIFLRSLFVPVVPAAHHPERAPEAPPADLAGPGA